MRKSDPGTEIPVATELVLSALRDAGILGAMLHRIDVQASEMMLQDGSTGYNLNVTPYPTERAMLTGKAPYPEQRPPGDEGTGITP